MKNRKRPREGPEAFAFWVSLYLFGLLLIGMMVFIDFCWGFSFGQEEVHLQG